MLERFKHYRHPRVPLYRKHKDQLAGFIHAEDMIRLVRDKVDLSTVDKQELLHPPIVVPPTKKVDEMFDFFKANNAHAAMVVNEHCGVDGMVTMGDVIYFLYGELAGRTISEAAYRQVDENTFEFAGEMSLSDFNDLTNFGVKDSYMTTFGGMIMAEVAHIPQEGESVEKEGYRFVVEKSTRRAIESVRVEPV
jgi:CBS domain containing-hemolysin-like protein